MKPRFSLLIVLIIVFVVLLVLVLPQIQKNTEQTVSKVSNQKVLELRFLHYSAEYDEAFKSIANEFMKNRKGVQVTVEVVTTDYNAVLKSRDAANQLPEIFMASTAGEPALKAYIRANKIQPVGSLKVISQLPEAIQRSITFSDGKIYLIPITNSVRGIIYNKELFEKLGLKKPETFSELKMVAKVLKDNGIIPFALAAKDGWTLGSNIFQVGQELMCDRDWLKRKWEGKASFSENTSEIFDFVDFVMQNCQSDYSNTDYINSLSLIANEKAAMVIQGNFAIPEIIKMNPDMKKKLGFMAIPFTDDREKTKLYFDTNNYAVVNAKADINLVDEFFDFLINSEEAKKLFWEKLYPISPYGINEENLSPFLKEVYEYINSNNFVANFLYNNMPDGMWQVFATAMQEYIINKAPRQKVVKIMDEGFDKLSKSYSQ